MRSRWRRATARAAPLPPALPFLNRLKAAAVVMTNALKNAGPVRTMNAPAAWPDSVPVMNHGRNVPTLVTAAPSARTSAAAADPLAAVPSSQHPRPKLAPAQRLSPIAPLLRMLPTAPREQQRPTGLQGVQKVPAIARPPEVPAAAVQHLAPGTTAPASTTDISPIAAAAAPAGHKPAGLQRPGGASGNRLDRPQPGGSRPQWRRAPAGGDQPDQGPPHGATAGGGRQHPAGAATTAPSAP